MAEIEFPMYFSLAPNPGYNESLLETRGYEGEYDMFAGSEFKKNNVTGDVTWKWGSVNHSIEGKRKSLVR